MKGSMTVRLTLDNGDSPHLAIQWPKSARDDSKIGCLPSYPFRKFGCHPSISRGVQRKTCKPFTNCAAGSVLLANLSSTDVGSDYVVIPSAGACSLLLQATKRSWLESASFRPWYCAVSWTQAWALLRRPAMAASVSVRRVAMTRASDGAVPKAISPRRAWTRVRRWRGQPGLSVCPGPASVRSARTWRGPG